MNESILLVLYGLVGLMIASQFFMIIPAYMGRLVINIFTGNLRPLGAGLRLVWPWEKTVDDSDTDLITLSHQFEMNLEAENGDPVPLKFDFTTYPSVRDLIQFRRFKKEERIKAITENLKSFLTSIQKNYKNRKDIMEHLKDTTDQNITDQTRKFIATGAISGKMTIREYYGVEVPVFLTADVELPQELRDATIKAETTKKENERRTKEMDNVRQRALKMVKDSNGTLRYEDALRNVYVKDGIVKDDGQLFGLHPGSRGPIIEIIKEVISKWLRPEVPK